MSLSLVAHDPSVAEDGDTSPTELGRKMRELGEERQINTPP